MMRPDACGKSPHLQNRQNAELILWLLSIQSMHSTFLLESSLYIYAPKSTQSILFPFEPCSAVSLHIHLYEATLQFQFRIHVFSTLTKKPLVSNCSKEFLEVGTHSCVQGFGQYKREPKSNPLIAPIHFVPPPDSYSPQQWNGDETDACRKSHLIYRIGKMRIDSLAILYSKHAQPFPF
ncbi:hypothetical protein CEXT_623501 [Caerostris extrusa]|uniref:Uncharacterized protein n=1 Tax=Caerostris extrusa TaxID=172846 RepID=A0AAV4UIV9_CAEEX|nr:hypothetical protein CEXT_623501 [Caerostris extrusa]